MDNSAEQLETVCVSAGKIGYQVELAPDALSKMISMDFCELT